MKRTITVPSLESHTRLDKFLVAELGSAWSRSAIQRAIEHGDATVNGARVPVHHFLKTGDTIELKLADEAPEHPQLTPNKTVQFVIVNETPDYIVIDKPAGLVVHPAPGVHEPTLADGLVAHFPELTNVGDDPVRPGIVHRLDREVSGLMVIARNPETFAHLKTIFAARLVDKQYVALVIGKLAKLEGTITFPLSRGSGRRGRMAARPSANEDTRDAITHFIVRQQFQQVALLDVKIETGRTHQIRAHLAALGHPIVGDQVYRPKALAFKANPGRIFLHSAALAFTDAAGVARKFESPLPPELAAFLSTLR